MKLKNRIFAFVLVLALCVSMTPFSAFAETADASFSEAENQTSGILSTEETGESDGAEENPVPTENPEQEQGPAATAESLAVAPTEPPVSEGETAEEPQPEPAPTATPEPEYVPGFTVEVRGGQYGWPVPSSAEVSQGYAVSRHEALDISASEGDSVLAAETGTVSAVQTWDGVSTEGDQSYGNMVMISHADGNTTLYAHLSEITVTEGQTVERGEEIGLVGVTGNVTGPHLHFEVIFQDGKVDPTDYITGGTGEESEEPNDEVPVYRVLGQSNMRRAAGQKGTLRVLYYVFQTEVGALNNFDPISRLPAKAVLSNGIYKAAYCLDEHLAVSNGNEYTWSNLEWGKKQIMFNRS